METIDRLRILLSKYGIKEEKVTPGTTVQSFKMLSEELDSFFADFEAEFDIAGEGFNYYDYFLEDVHPGQVIVDSIYSIFNPKKLQRKALTIDHLIKVAEQKKWYDPK